MNPEHSDDDRLGPELDPAVIGALATAPTPEPREGFWDDLRTELTGSTIAPRTEHPTLTSIPTLPVEQGSFGRVDGHDHWARRNSAVVLVAAAGLLVAVAVGATLWSATGETEVVGVATAVGSERSVGEPLPTPIGPLDLLVHGSNADGPVMAASRETGETGTCDSGENEPFEGPLRTLVLVDPNGIDLAEVDSVITDEGFGPASVQVGNGPSHAVVGPCSDGASGLSLIPSDTTGDGRQVLERPADATGMGQPVWSVDGRKLYVRYHGIDRGVDGSVGDAMVTHDAETGDIIDRNPGPPSAESSAVEPILMAELADGTRLTRERSADRWYLNDTPLALDFDLPATAVVSPDGLAVAVFGGDGLAVIEAGATEPSHRDPRNAFSVVEWLPDGSLVAANHTVQLFHVDVDDPSSRFSTHRIVEDLGLPPMTVASLTAIANGRLAVSGPDLATGEITTWIIDQSEVSSSNGLIVDEMAEEARLVEMLPEADDLGPEWQQLNSSDDLTSYEINSRCGGEPTPIRTPVMRDFISADGATLTVVLLADDSDVLDAGMAGLTSHVPECAVPPVLSGPRSVEIGGQTVELWTAIETDESSLLLARINQDVLALMDWNASIDEDAALIVLEQLLGR